jgi:hypothetical protein
MQDRIEHGASVLVFRTVAGSTSNPSGERLRQNAAMPARKPRLQLIAPSASPEEAAAVVAALERFMRATAPAPASAAEPSDPWRRAAILEGVEREVQGDLGDPWLRV